MKLGLLLRRHFWLCILLTLAVSAAMAPGLLKIRIDPSFDSFLPPEDSATVAYQQFLRDYGNDGVVLLGVNTGEPILSLRSRRRLDKIVREVRDDGQVESVMALSAGLMLDRAEPGSVPLSAAALLISELNPELQARIRAAPFVDGFLLGRDGSDWAAVMMFTRSEVRTNLDSAGAFIARLRAIKQRAAEDSVQVALTGIPVLKVELRTAVVDDLVRLSPISFLCVTVCLILMFRSLRDLLIAQLTILLALVWSFSIIGWLGWAVSNLSATLPSVIFVVGVADTIHIITVYRLHRSRGLPKQDALPRTVAETVLPCLLTSVTTMLGFLSLSVSELPPIREYGLLAAFGVFSAFTISMLFVPCALFVCDRHAPGVLPPRVGGLALGRFLKTVETLVFRRPWWVLTGFALLTLAALAGIPHVTDETDFFSFLPADNEVNQGSAVFSREFAGIGSYEYLARSSQGFRSPAQLRTLAAIEARIGSWPTVRQTVSVVDFLKLQAMLQGGLAAESYALPSDSAGLTKLLDNLEQSDFGSQSLPRYVRPDWREVRISAWAPPARSELVQSFRDSLAVLTQEYPDLEIVKTGSDEVFFKMARALVDSQKNSFLLAVITIIVAITVLFMSLRMGLFSILPNIFPLAVAFGLMAYLGIPLNTATAMVVPITLGIAVDDTIHFLAGYRRFQKEGLSPREAVRATLEDVGSAVSTTSLILVLGFGALLFGSFNPTGHFAVLTIFTVIAAWLGDVLLLPVLLDRIRPDFSSVCERNPSE